MGAGANVDAIGVRLMRRDDGNFFSILVERSGIYGHDGEMMMVRFC